MFFWFKKKKIILDMFTDDYFAYEYCKPLPANKHYPEWVKDLNNERVTLKQCVGFTELYKNSFIFPFWNTLTLINLKTNNSTVVNNDINHEFFSSEKIAITQHPRFQFNGLLSGGSNIRNIKLISPWLFKSKKYLQFLWHAPLWNYELLNNFHLLPAIVDFKYNLDTNINFIYDSNIINDTLVITPNTPLVMLTPLITDINEVELRYHLIEKTMFNSMKHAGNYRIYTDHNNDQFNLSLSKIYKLKKKFVDNCDEKEEKIKKCPFGFGKKY